MGPTGLRPNSGNNSRRIVKREKVKKFYEKVKPNIGGFFTAKKTISKRVRSRRKKLRVYDLSSLADVLPDVNVATLLADAAKLKLNCKSRKKLVQRESNQLKAVLSHPAFHSDPISAIHQHLERTQPLVGQGTSKNKKSRSDKKERRRDLSSGSQSMER